MLAHDENLVGLDDRLLLAFDQRRAGEVVHVVNRPDHQRLAGVTRPAALAPVADAARGTSRDAVLRMHNGVPGGLAGQRVRQRVHAGEHPFLQSRPHWRGRNDRERSADRPVETRDWIAECEDADRVAGLMQRLGQGKGMHYAAAWLDRVGQQGDRGWRGHRAASAASSGRRAAIAAAVLAAPAAVAARITPASASLARWESYPCGSARVPST